MLFMRACIYCTFYMNRIILQLLYVLIGYRYGYIAELRLFFWAGYCYGNTQQLTWLYMSGFNTNYIEREIHSPCAVMHPFGIRTQLKRSKKEIKKLTDTLDPYVILCKHIYLHVFIDLVVMENKFPSRNIICLVFQCCKCLGLLIVECQGFQYSSNCFCTSNFV